MFLFCSKPIRYLASYTFVLYLLHYPLLQFFSTITFNEELSEPNPGIVVAATLLVVWVIGGFTEKNKKVYKKYFTSIWKHTCILFRGN